jgi:hypothetical protein
MSRADVNYVAAGWLLLLQQGERIGYNTDVYSEPEVERIARVAFDAARKRGKRLCSVEKSNVLEVSQLWKEVRRQSGADQCRAGHRGVREWEPGVTQGWGYGSGRQGSCIGVGRCRAATGTESRTPQQPCYAVGEQQQWQSSL